MFDRLKQGWTSFMTLVTPGENSAGWRRAILTGMGFLIILILLVGMYWSNEPAEFDVRVNAGAKLASSALETVPGAITTSALIRVAETLLDKPGGYLTNDVMLPGYIWTTSRTGNLAPWSRSGICRVHFGKISAAHNPSPLKTLT